MDQDGAELMSASMSRSGSRASTTVVCGVPIDDVTLSETVDRVAELVERGRVTGRTHQVATVNVNFIVNAVADPTLLSLLQRADLAIPDGMPLVWGSRLLGSPLRERVAGADLVPALAERSAASGYSMYLFGAAEGVARRAAALLRARHPGLRVIGESGPFFATPDEMDHGALQRIREAQPDILCVALGHPKQERWIEMYRRALGVPVAIGVGGSLDFLAGATRRAPGWMQRSGVEWVHRAMREPGRLLQRYARDAVRFGPQLLRDVLVVRRVADGRAQPCEVHRRDNTTVVRPQGRLDLSAATLGWSGQEWLAPPAGHHVVIDLAELDALGHAELSVVVGLAKRLAERGGWLTLSSVPATIARIILDLRLYDFLPTTSLAVPDGPLRAEDTGVVQMAVPDTIARSSAAFPRGRMTSV
jgi:N-acetylglucosaminyldiphosphoundecaprenol N-acetyl-beta-D-mannosaminyltransferase